MTEMRDTIGGAVEMSLEIEPHHLEWLANMQAKFEKQSVDTVLYCLLEHVMTEVDDATLFGKTRCKSHHGKVGKVKQNFAMDSAQSAWLEAKAAEHGLPDAGKAVRVVLEYACVSANSSQAFSPPATKAPKPKSKAKVAVTVEVEKRHVDWLEQNLRAFKLPDAGKAMRCLLEYVRAEVEDPILFGKTRCKAICGGQKLPQTFSVEADQQAWLTDKVDLHRLPDIGKAVRIVLEFGVTEADPKSVFGIIRKACQHGPNCKKCNPVAAKPDMESTLSSLQHASRAVVIEVGGSQDDEALEVKTEASDMVSALQERSGALHGLTVIAKEVVNNNIENIQAAVRKWCEGEQKADLVITVGGTGFGPHDLTPEATFPLLDKQAPGLVAVMLAKSMEISPTNMLSRPSAGMRNNTLIINMPGDSSAFVECLDALMPALPHGLKQLRGEVEMNHPRHVPHGGLNSGCGCDH
mmetsp:Transcript_36499/g.70024  ORF Transcript_36499/g.70024 Transcript_36499/m.70024 type:complete len:465 (-) Transcript_36499:1159-2553(-)